ncbi:MAG: hypothetical protein NTX79_02255 [Candidatus Micrarchaeota archaeon]|nr:hypothetical protein [Candidatus Micrarchaeota archaeon]
MRFLRLHSKKQGPGNSIASLELALQKSILSARRERIICPAIRLLPVRFRKPGPGVSIASLEKALQDSFASFGRKRVPAPSLEKIAHFHEVNDCMRRRLRELDKIPWSSRKQSRVDMYYKLIAANMQRISHARDQRCPDLKRKFTVPPCYFRKEPIFRTMPAFIRQEPLHEVDLLRLQVA